MSEITLFAMPGSCSRVSLILLEEAKAKYDIHWVNLMKAEHKSAEFKQINPKSKVPALAVESQVLTENPMIIKYISERFPEANLLPKVDSGLAEYQQISDLCFCSSTIHPLVTRFCIPAFFADENGMPSVKAKALEALMDSLAWVEQRLAAGNWWYGEQWSAVDAYIFWIISRLQRCEFSLATLPNLAHHTEKMLKRDSVINALNKEKLANF
ncbi:glutathione S-transferase family protein [Aliiglaciecola sp. 2_MG-2023]|uniref:glutathione S-transferase family protein n=1 Tax=Alteromonadaceae TaxID=72275 RepID=UPI0026E210AC|nr:MULTISPECIES: glutathione S-transferase family protein [unclassified Aliiglaciecola]MDO6710177.1 glutathione S-transferase family protein [Aliiglaciecola sp. 2_MG-2023]MDO6751325.1 glutathione S-transferase family protein [Aliiglaciecola sp. 1_MG-2023]